MYIYTCKVSARGKRKKGGMTTSKELRQGKEGRPPSLPLWLMTYTCTCTCI